jgi:hypothetical protein
MYSASIRHVYREVILQENPRVALPTAPTSLDEATGSSRSPTPGDARRRAVEVVSTERRRAGSRASPARRSCRGKLPAKSREARERGRRQRKTTSLGQLGERGSENTDGKKGSRSGLETGERRSSPASSVPGKLLTAPRRRRWPARGARGDTDRDGTREERKRNSLKPLARAPPLRTLELCCGPRLPE